MTFGGCRRGSGDPGLEGNHHMGYRLFGTWELRGALPEVSGGQPIEVCCGGQQVSPTKQDAGSADRSAQNPEQSPSCGLRTPPSWWGPCSQREPSAGAGGWLRPWGCPARFPVD